MSWELLWALALSQALVPPSLALLFASAWASWMLRWDRSATGGSSARTARNFALLMKVQVQVLALALALALMRMQVFDAVDQMYAVDCS